MDIGVRVRPVTQTHRIALNISPDCRVIVSEDVLLQSGLAIEDLYGEAQIVSEAGLRFRTCRAISIRHPDGIPLPLINVPEVDNGCLFEVMDLHGFHSQFNCASRFSRICCAYCNPLDHLL